MSEKEKKISILIVDDEEDILLSLRGILRKHYKIVTANSGAEAIEIFSAAPNEYPIVISDQRMPGMQGHELLKAIHEINAETIGFLLTGYTNFDDLINAVNEGHIYTYLSKPVDPDDLKMRVLYALDLYDARQDNQRLTEELKDINQNLELRIEEQTALLRKQLNQIESELDQARHTQLSLLPSKLPNTKFLQTSARFVPMDQVGGDFYDVFDLPEGKKGFIVADVTGHGVAAAMISFMLAIVFRNYISMMKDPEDLRPGKTIEQVNEMLQDQMPEGKFATIFYCVYDPVSKKLSYSSAGHPPACLLRKNGDLEELHTEGMVLGMFPNFMADFEEREVQLETGDKIMIYTDAIIELDCGQGVGGEGLAWDLLHKLLRANYKEPIPALISKIENGILEEAKQTKYDDDLTILGFEII